MVIAAQSVSPSLIDRFPNATTITLQVPYESFSKSFVKQVQHLIITCNINYDMLVPFAHVQRIEFQNCASGNYSKLLSTALAFNIPSISMQVRSITICDVPIVQSLQRLNRVAIDYTWLQQCMEKQKLEDDGDFNDFYFE